MIIGKGKRHQVVIEFLDTGIPRSISTNMAVSCEGVALLNKLLIEGEVTKSFKGLTIPIFIHYVGLSVPRLSESELVKKFSVSWVCVRESILRVVNYISINTRLYQLAKSYVDYRKVNQKDTMIESKED